MGGIATVFKKVGIGGGGAAAAEAIQSAASQSTQQATVDSQSSDRENKRMAAKGKKKLQIPDAATSGVATPSTGTGVNTGA
jgi:hypothetical protein